MNKLYHIDKTPLCCQVNGTAGNCLKCRTGVCEDCWDAVSYITNHLIGNLCRTNEESLLKRALDKEPKIDPTNHLWTGEDTES